MLPFARIVQYGNVLPTSVKVVDMDAYSGYVAILTNDGKLYFSSPTLFGTSDGAWTLSRNDVEKMYCTWNAVLVKTYDQKYYYLGSNIFSTTSTATKTLTWTECTTKFDQFNTIDIKKILIYTNNVFVLLNDGTVYVVGYNGGGVYGTGNTTGSATFVQSNITSVQDIYVAGDNSGTNIAFLAYNGTQLYGCGQSYYGILGTGGSANATQSSWYRITNTCTDFKSLSIKNIAFKNGSWYEKGNTVFAYSWGTGTTSQSGGFPDPHVLTTSVPVSTYYNSHENSSTFAIGTDGKLYASGTNQFGSLGIGTTVNQLTLVPVVGFDTPENIKSIVSYAFNSYILTVGGILYYTGRNITKLPTGITGTISTFTPVILPLAS